MCNEESLYFNFKMFSHYDALLLQAQTFIHFTGSCLTRDTLEEPYLNVKPCDGSRLQKWFLVNRNYNIKSEL